MSQVNYIVILDQAPTHTDFDRSYFPHAVFYPLEAEELVVAIEQQGGKAHIVPRSQFTPELMQQLKE